MRILLSCLQSSKHHSLPAYGFWRAHFVNACAEAGIECLEVPGVDWAEGLVHPSGRDLEQWRERVWDVTLAFAREQLKRGPVDCFLGYLYPKQIDVGAISALQKLGIPCVNFFCDNVREFRRVPAEFRPFALHWVPEFEAVPMYRDAGLSYLHAPMPCWIAPTLRCPAQAETEPPTFIGSADPLRRHLLGRAIQAGADLVACGPGWDLTETSGFDQAPARPIGRMLGNQFDLMREHGLTALYRKLENRVYPIEMVPISKEMVKPPVSDQEYVRITREAIVVLGINRVPTARASNRHPLTYSRLRDIEAPMMGACYLTEWTAGLGELYELGEEIESYRTPEELCSKLAELKMNSVRRRSMRQRAQRRALADHAAVRTLGRISAHLGLGRPS